MTHGVSRDVRTGAPTLSLVTVAQMKRTGKPETVSLTVNGPTRTYGQHTKPTPCAGPGAGATGRTEHMQEQKNNTEPKFTTNVYVHEPDIQVPDPRIHQAPTHRQGHVYHAEPCTRRRQWPLGAEQACKEILP